MDALLDGLPRPPADLELERAILGSTLDDIANVGAARDVAERLTLEDFDDLRHHAIFRTVCELVAEGEHPTVRSFLARLRERGREDEAGGAAYVAGLVEAMPLSTQVAGQISALKRITAQRRWYAVGYKLLRAGSAAPEQIAEYVTDQLAQARDGGGVGPAPVSLLNFLSAAREARDWVVKGLLERGRLAVLGGEPKAGKSTLAGWLASFMARGLPFIGMETAQAPVLWIGLEEHPDELARRFRDVGLPTNAAHVYCGPVQGRPDAFIRAMGRHARKLGAGLVVLDTLGHLLRASDENDASAMGRAMTPLREAARESGAGWLALHHLRKSAGEGLSGVRGSSALTGEADAVGVLTRSEGRRRRLHIEGRLGEDKPDDSIIELAEDGTGYRLVGSASEEAEHDLARQILDALPESEAEATPAAEVLDAVQGRRASVLRALRVMQAAGTILATGAGVRGKPRLYWRPESDSVPGRGVGTGNGIPARVVSRG